MPRYTASIADTRKSTNESWDNVIGFVTKVHEHDGTETQISNHEVNIQLKHREEEFRRVPVHTDHNGSIYVPKEDDMVEVGFLKSKTQRPVVVNVVYTDEVRAPLARSGHFRREFEKETGDNLYFEVEPKGHESITPDSGEPETVRMAVKKDGLSDPVARIEIDLSGSDPVLRMTRGEEEQGNTDMGLEMDFGSGEFKIGDGDGFGIVSDGSGNFTWYEQTVNFVDDGSTINW